ncbi:hypothetical protein J6590_022330 [Homalodisca vitripennis]|nr:hypothetical protein J6590_022330 [Homalodisca vitripennis]
MQYPGEHGNCIFTHMKVMWQILPLNQTTADELFPQGRGQNRGVPSLISQLAGTDICQVFGGYYFCLLITSLHVAIAPQIISVVSCWIGGHGCTLLVQRPSSTSLFYDFASLFHNPETSHRLTLATEYYIMYPSAEILNKKLSVSPKNNSLPITIEGVIGFQEVVERRASEVINTVSERIMGLMTYATWGDPLPLPTSHDIRLDTR